MTRISVCCGVGGTGKTTTSAALAVGRALAGERVAVLTIDPARRLADALGIDALGNDPVAVEVPGAPGRLWALMLDRKGTWDAVIRERARPEIVEKLLVNPYYQAVSTRLSGSHEYMAVEKLHDLVHSGSFDRIIVDTPPAQHVTDFFQAPERISRILDRSLMSGLLEPGRVRGAATRGAFAIIHRLAGDRVMSEIREFFHLMGDMSTGFRERSARIGEILVSPSTSYWLIANAQAPERNDLLGFLAELRERRMHFSGFLINRVQRIPSGPFPGARALHEAGAGLPGWPQMADALLQLPPRLTARAAAQRDAIHSLTEAAGGAPAWLVPDVPGGVRSLAELARLSTHLPPAAPDLPGRGGPGLWARAG